MDITDKLRTVDQLRARIEAHGKIEPALLKKINYRFRLDWNFYSNSMEGNTLTKDETRSIMIGQITVNGKPMRDVLEMRGHDMVITDILRLGKGELHLSERRIRDIHRGIMHEENDEEKAKIGVWKKVNNYLYTYKNERFDFAEPHEVPEMMHQLLDWLNNQIDNPRKKDALHPVLLALEFHLRYVTIHPFYDGNGRTARIFMNLILIAQGFPPIIIKPVDKGAYHQYLGDVQAYGGAKDFYYGFMIDLLIRSQQLVISALEGGSLEEPNDLDRHIELMKSKLNNMDVVVSDVRSLKTTNTVLTDNIFPLLQLLEEKLAMIQDLFHSSDRRIQYLETVPKKDLTGAWDDMRNWLTERAQSNYFDPEDDADERGATDFSYFFQLKGFKKAYDLQYLSITIAVQFQEFDYIIKINYDHKTERKFGYGQIISKQIREDIVREVMMPIITQIERASGIE